VAVSTASTSVSVPVAKNKAFVANGDQNALRGLLRSAFFLFLLLFAPIPVRAEPLVPENASARDNCPAFGATEEVRVAFIFDGDTLRLADGRVVRLPGVNAPELGNRGKPDQPVAAQARRAVQDFLPPGGGARLLVDAGNSDRYGRLLAHIYSHEGQSLEVMLLARGLAWHVAVPPNLRLASCLAAVEAHARDRGEGVWSSVGIPAVAATAVTSGGYQRVYGRLAGLDSGRSWWLHLEGSIDAVIYPEHQHRFDLRKLQALVGRQVELQGWVYPAHSGKTNSGKARRWRMKLETPFALEAN